MSDESLLDVFVNVGAKGIKEVDAEIAAFVEKAKKAFGDIKGPAIKQSIDKTADAEMRAAEKTNQFLRKLREQSVKDAQKQAAEEQRALERTNRFLQKISQDRAKVAEKTASDERLAAERANKIIEKANQDRAKLAEKIAADSARKTAAEEEVAAKQTNDFLKRIGQDRAAEAKRIAAEEQEALNRTNQFLEKSAQERSKEAKRIAAEEQKALDQTNQFLKKSAQERVLRESKLAEAQERASQKAIAAAAKLAEAQERASQKAIKVSAIEGAKQEIESLRQAVLKFGKDKDQISIGVRLLGNADVKRQLSDIQTQVNEAKKEFSLSEPGEAGASTRAAAVEKITSLREKELDALRKVTEAEIAAKGLDSVYATRAEKLRGATDEAESFAAQLREVNSLVSKSGNTNLKEEFESIRKSAERIKGDLKAALASGDLVGTEAAINDMEVLRKKVDSVRVAASQQIELNLDASFLKSELDLAKQKFDSLNKLLSFETRGRLDLDEKLALAKVEMNMRDILILFDALSKKTNKTQADFIRLQDLSRQFGEATSQITELKNGIAAAGKGTNSLSNNAYQIGQAFEDAAVGFSLNGITGAVRGAANNVAFLVNNLSQAGQLTTLLGARTAALLPLYTGLGTAALFIIPGIYKWLTAVEDVEEKSNKLLDLFSRDFSDIKFRVSITVDAAESAKSLREAKSALDSIEILIQRFNESEKINVKINASIDEIAASKSLKAFNELKREISVPLRLPQDSLDKIRRDIRNQEREVASRTPEDIRFQRGRSAVSPALIAAQRNAEKAVASYKPVTDEFAKIEKALDNVFSKGPGFDDPVAFQETINSFDKVIDGYETITKVTKRSKEETEKDIEAFKAFRGELQNLNEDIQKSKQLKDFKLSDALQAGVENAEKLNRELRLEQDILRGAATEEDRLLFKLNEERLAVKKINDELLKKNKNSAIAVKLASQNTEELRLQQEVELTRKIAELRQEIADAEGKARKSAKGRNDSPQQRSLGDPGAVVLGVLGDALDPEVEAMNKLNEQMKSLEEELKRLREKVGGTKKDLPTLPGFAPEDAPGAQVPFNARAEADRELRRSASRAEELRRAASKAAEEEAKRKSEEQMKKDGISVKSDRQEQRFKEIMGLPVMSLKEEQEKKAREVLDNLREERESQKLPPQFAPEDDQLIQRDAEADKRRAEEDRKRLEEDKRKKDQQLKDWLNDPSSRSFDEFKEKSKPREYPSASFAPEDSQNFQNAQANANARAMENTNFTSTTLQDLIATSNEILGKLNENVTKLDTTSRYS